MTNMAGVAMRMSELMTEVTAAAATWEQAKTEMAQAGRDQRFDLDAEDLGPLESEAHAALLNAILTYADEYRAFEEMQGLLHSLEHAPGE